MSAPHYEGPREALRAALEDWCDECERELENCECPLPRCAECADPFLPEELYLGQCQRCWHESAWPCGYCRRSNAGLGSEAELCRDCERRIECAYEARDHFRDLEGSR